MKQLHDLYSRILNEGFDTQNRTGIPTRALHGVTLTFDMDDGFPAVTTKQLYFKSCFAEMLGFLRGYDNAAQFRELGTKVWDANANENDAWLANPYRKGRDDLGRIYGVQARKWRYLDVLTGEVKIIDQFANIVADLSKGIDNRREIVMHWNPSELNQMALPPCHVMYQFGIAPLRDVAQYTDIFGVVRQASTALDLSLIMRSWDCFLGAPFNIAGYAFLLHLVAQVTKHKPGKLTIFAHNAHLYHNHFAQVEEMMSREPFPLPELRCDFYPTGELTLQHLEQDLTPSHFWLYKYVHHKAIPAPMAV